MNREEIKSLLVEKHLLFADYLSDLSDEDFVYKLDGKKWNAGQEAIHIIKSVKALQKGLGTPKFVLRATIGKANRPSRSYEGVKQRYLERLGERPAITTAPFEPDTVSVEDRGPIVQKLNDKVHGLCKALDRYSEKELDKYILPHPALGKLTLREMAYFTAYHVEHHMQNSVRNLASLSKSD